MENRKIVLITGITGQDGSYLTELLLGKEYTVHGIVRRTSNLLRSRIEHLRRDDQIYGKKLFLHYGDLSDTTTLRRIFREVQPAEVYHLAGQSHVGLSFELPESTCDEAGMATLRLLEIVRDQAPDVRFYHASTSEIFGNASESPQWEETPMHPTSPYGCAKAFATQLARAEMPRLLARTDRSMGGFGAFSTNARDRLNWRVSIPLQRRTSLKH